MPNILHQMNLFKLRFYENESHRVYLCDTLDGFSSRWLQHAHLNISTMKSHVFEDWLTISDRYLHLVRNIWALSEHGPWTIKPMWNYTNQCNKDTLLIANDKWELEITSCLLPYDAVRKKVNLLKVHGVFFYRVLQPIDNCLIFEIPLDPIWKFVFYDRDSDRPFDV